MKLKQSQTMIQPCQVEKSRWERQQLVKVQSFWLIFKVRSVFEKKIPRPMAKQKITVLIVQALFFTGFWTSPTNGFGGFLSLEKNP